MLGAHVVFGCPVGYSPDEAELERLDGLGEGDVRLVHRAADAVAGATAVHTDTWTSMGQEAEKAERAKVFEAFTVDAKLMAMASPAAGFYHCLPAYRGLEVAAEVIDGPQSVVWDEAENRLHVQKALMEYLLIGRIG